MRPELREVFVAEDGTVFETVEAAQAHEREVEARRKRIAGLKVYTVSHAFEATEGRGYLRSTYIVTDADYMVVLAYCFDRFGKPLSAWYGDGFFETWIIRSPEMTAEDAIRRSRQPFNGFPDHKPDLVFLSAKDLEHPDLPARVFPWPPKPAEKNA